MKVALISSEGGGISSVASGLGRSLAKKDIDTTIFTYSRTMAAQKTKLSEHFWQYSLPTPNLPPRHYWFQAVNFKLLLKELRNYDVIHGVSPNASFFLSLFKEKLEKPFVATLHEDIRTSQKAFIKQPVTSWAFKEMGYFFLEFPLFDIPAGKILKSSDYATFCSHSLLNQVAGYRDIDYDKTSVIHNGLDFEEIESVKSEHTPNDDNISLIYAGRLMRVKGVMFLLDAYTRVVSENPNVTLRIFGKGPLAHEIERTIAQRGLEKNVQYLGQVSHKRLIAEIKKSDISVFPSLNEAQPMVVLEAMACKKPVIAFDFPFASEVITNMSTGLLAKPGDISDLSLKMKTLIQNKQLRIKLGQAAYDYVLKHHNWDIQAEKYLEIYQHVIDNKKIMLSD